MYLLRSLSCIASVLLFSAGIMLVNGCSNKTSNIEGTSSQETTEARTPQLAHKTISLSEGEATNSSIPAPSWSNEDWSTLDVAGIRLGMTPEQAIAALKAFDSQLYFSKRYLTGKERMQSDRNGIRFLSIFDNILEGGLPYKCTDSHIFAGIRAGLGTTLHGGDKYVDDLGNYSEDTYAGCEEDKELLPGIEPEIISVLFTPIPGQHRVIGVSLWKQYKAPQTIESVLGAALAKYPAEFTAMRENRSENMHLWRYDARGRLISKTMGDHLGLGYSKISVQATGSGIPSQVEEGRGVGIDLVIDPNTNNPSLAEQFRISMYDEDAIFKLLKQTEQIYKIMQDEKIKQQTDKASRSGSKVRM